MVEAEISSWGSFDLQNWGIGFLALPPKQNKYPHCPRQHTESVADSKKYFQEFFNGLFVALQSGATWAALSKVLSF